MKKEITINMPQMALEALSENWLFKELGGIHWDLICNGLNSTSSKLRNDTDDRLYATFVRIRIHSTKHLKAFKENNILGVDSSIKRFGKSMYFSDINLEMGDERIVGQLMTTFSIRNATDNTKLAKSEPNIEANAVEQFKTFPSFGNEYRLVKKRILKNLVFNELDFQVDYEAKPIFETTYELNPYYDLNGVNLLYFAAYPIINDFCEAKYFNMLLPNERWEQTYYTAYKDVFYYSNCNINERVIYKLMTCEQIDDNRYKISSLLVRESDKTILARIFSVKSKAK